MKHREAPAAKALEVPWSKLREDPQVWKFAKRLRGDDRATPADLSQEEVEFVTEVVTRFRHREFEQDDLEKAMAKTAPVIAAPTMQNTAADLATILAQPEMVKLMAEWDGPHGQRGGGANWHGIKSVMVAAAMTGLSAHIDDAHESLVDSPLGRVLERAGQAAARERGEDEAPLTLPSCSYALRRMKHCALDGADLAMATNVELVRQLRILYPNKGIGERLMIDGTRMPAWCKQASGGREGKGSTLDQWYRRNIPEAGFRSYMHTSTNKRDIQRGDNPKTVVIKGKAWRGYYLVCIADQATGLPLVWLVMDAADDEARAMIGLLSKLHQLWPECPAELIAGDSAWDEDWACRACEVEWGIHPVFRKKPSKSGTLLNPDKFDTIHAITSEGQMICRKHLKKLAFESAEAARRVNRDGDPLRPGQTAKPEGNFRIRAVCEHGAPGDECGRVGMPMQAGRFDRMTYFPHYAQGNPRRYAMRVALLTRLNGMEQLFNRLKSGRKLATDGGDRTRIRHKGACEALVSLAFVSMTAAAVADARNEAGIVHELPTDPVAPAPVLRPRSVAPIPSVAPAPAASTPVLSPGAARAAGLLYGGR